MSARASALLTVLLLAGCASTGPDFVDSLRAGQPQRVELETVAFHPQEALQCGPAALATVLNASGVAVTPDELAPRVFLPERGGSLQVELIGATRRYERLPYVLRPAFADLLAEVAAGHPVLVLQNLGLRSLPAWHFAVVVGYDVTEETLVLRSGGDARLIVRARRFFRSWDRAGRWAMLALDPATVPATAAPEPYLTAAAGLEASGARESAARAYRAAAREWPDEPLPWLGLGNVALAEGHHAEAIGAYRNALDRAPENVVARNNLAHALAVAGCVHAAQREIARAVKLAEDGPFGAQTRATAAEIAALVLTSSDQEQCNSSPITGSATGS